MSTLTWVAEADFDLDGDFETALTGYVESPARGVRIDRAAAPDGTPRSSQVNFGLSNRTGDFTPENTSSPFAGQVRPGVPVRATCTLSGLGYTLWTGYMRRLTASWASGTVPTSDMQARDLGDYLRESDPVNVTASTSRDTDAALTAIATALDLTADDLDFDDGVEDLPMHFVRNQDALTAMLDVVASEMGGNLWVTAGGKLRFESRRNRLGTSALRRAIMKRGPVGYWRLGDVSGTTMTDSSGNGRDGTYRGSPTLKTASLEATGGDFAATFTAASSQWADVPDNNAWSINTTGFLSGFALLKMSALTATNAAILSKGSGAGLEWIFYVNNAGGLVFLVTTAAGVAINTAATANGVIVPGTTYAVGFSVTATTPTIYLDGAAVGTLTPGAGAYTNGTGLLYVGEGWALGFYENGVLDELALFPTALTAEEHHDLYMAARQNNWGDGTSVIPNAITYELDPAAYVTTVSARATKFLSGQADTPLFAFSENMFTKPAPTSMALSAGQVWERTFDAQSVYLTLTTPEAVTDYTANTQANGAGTDKTSALEVTVTDLGGGRFTLRLKNTDAGTIYVTALQVRGQPVEFFADRPEASFTLSVPGMKAGKSISFDIPFAGDSDQKLRDYAYQELRVGRYPYPSIRLGFTTRNDTEKRALLALELGDLVHYKDTGFGANGGYLDDWYYVEGVAINIPPDWAGQAFSAEVMLCPTYVYRDLDALVFDTFDRADAAGGLGAAFSDDVWADSSGFDIVGGKAVANTDALCLPNLDLGAGKTDQVVEVTLGNQLAEADGLGGVIWRMVDTSNYYQFYLHKPTTAWAVQKIVAGVATTVTSGTWTPTDSAEIRVVHQGQRIRVWVDGERLTDTTDSALMTGTKVGLLAFLADSGVTFSDFYGQAA